MKTIEERLTKLLKKHYDLYDKQDTRSLYFRKNKDATFIDYYKYITKFDEEFEYELIPLIQDFMNTPETFLRYKNYDHINNETLLNYFIQKKLTQ